MIRVSTFFSVSTIAAIPGTVMIQVVFLLVEFPAVTDLTAVTLSNIQYLKTHIYQQVVTRIKIKLHLGCGQ